MYVRYLFFISYRSDPPVIKTLGCACYAVLITRCNSREIVDARNKSMKFNVWFAPAAIIWTTLTLKFHFEHSEFAALCDDSLWKQVLLRDLHLLSLDSSTVNSIVQGLTLGKELGIPANASLITHITDLLAPERELYKFTEMRFAQNFGLQIANIFF